MSEPVGFRSAEPKPIGSEPARSTLAAALDRLSQCAASLRKIKQSPLAYVQLWVQNNLVSLLPEATQRQLALDIFSRHTMVILG